jgi:hypothetical protein
MSMTAKALAWQLETVIAVTQDICATNTQFGTFFPIGSGILRDPERLGAIMGLMYTDRIFSVLDTEAFFGLQRLLISSGDTPSYLSCMAGVSKCPNNEHREYYINILSDEASGNLPSAFVDLSRPLNSAAEFQAWLEHRGIFRDKINTIPGIHCPLCQRQMHGCNAMISDDANHPFATGKIMCLWFGVHGGFPLEYNFLSTFARNYQHETENKRNAALCGFTIYSHSFNEYITVRVVWDQSPSNKFIKSPSSTLVYRRGMVTEVSIQDIRVYSHVMNLGECTVVSVILIDKELLYV